MALSGSVAAMSFGFMLPDETIDSPSHAGAGRPMDAEITSCVPDFSYRLKMSAGSVHGATWESLPYPNTENAASALIDFCVDALGTVNMKTCTGPVKSPTKSGRPPNPAMHVSGNASQSPMSAA